MRDPNLPPERKPEVFLHWAARFYDPVDNIDNVSVSMLTEREKTLDLSTSTLSRMSKDTIASLADLTAFLKYNFVVKMSTVFREIAELALYDTQGAWKDLKLVLMWCDRSAWLTVWGAKIVADRMRSGGENMRKMQLVKLEDANHFVSNQFLPYDLSNGARRSCTGRNHRGCCEP